MQGTRASLAVTSFAVLAVSLACGSSSAPKAKASVEPPAKAAELAPAPAVHGMLVFGQSAMFVSHLPMFAEPHGYQVLAEVKLLTQPGQFGLGFLSEANPYGFHTLEPEPFVLSDMQKPGFRFPAKLHQGHFERPEHKELGPVVVEVVRLYRFAKLDPGEAKSPTYRAIVLGTDTGEYYLAHRVSGAPSFDQISLLIVSESRLSAAWTPGIEVSAVGRPDEPLARYDELQLEFAGGTVPAKTRAVYTETGELAK